MSRPSFQFYTKDWRANSKLRRCSPAARGVWIDILCALHDSDEYGIARYPLKELASEVGASLAHCRELVDKDVLKGCDAGAIEAYIYVPRSGRKDGPPVTLLPAQVGPLWYSSRMVKDEYVNTHRGEGTRFGDGKGESPKPAPKASPTRREGDGPSTASSSATAVKNPPHPPAGGEASFETFWSEWPTHKRKVAEDQCRKKWETRGCQPIAARVIEGLRQAKQSDDWLKDNGAFVPAPLKWLNQSMWTAFALLSAAWHETAGGIKAKGTELGIPYTTDDECKPFIAYRARVFMKAGHREEKAA